MSIPFLFVYVIGFFFTYYYIPTTITFDSFVKQLGFNQTYADTCVYNRSDDDNGFIIKALYVDHMPLLSNNVDLIDKIKKLLSSIGVILFGLDRRMQSVWALLG